MRGAEARREGNADQEGDRGIEFFTVPVRTHGGAAGNAVLTDRTPLAKTQFLLENRIMVEAIVDKDRVKTRAKARSAAKRHAQAQELVDHAATLAGVAEVLDLVIAAGGPGSDALGICLDAVNKANDGVSEIASMLQ